MEKPQRFGINVVARGRNGVNFVLRNKLQGPIFNNFDVGGYLDYRLYPSYQVFVDNRPEAYPKNFFANVYYPMQVNRQNFDTVDNTYHFNLVIYDHLDHDEQFLNMLVHHPDWQLVYLDNYLTVFVKKSVYPQIAQNYAVTEANFNYQSSDYYDNIFLARVSLFLGWNIKAQNYLRAAYQLNPNSLSALNTLGSQYVSNPATAILGRQMLERYNQRISLIWF